MREFKHDMSLSTSMCGPDSYEVEEMLIERLRAVVEEGDGGGPISDETYKACLDAVEAYDWIQSAANDYAKEVQQATT